MTSEIRHEWIEVEADDGRKFRSYLAIPEATPAVGLVMVHEIFGLNPTIRKLAHMFAERGCVVLAPDLFWRLADRAELTYSAEDRPIARSLNKQFDYTSGVSDLSAAVRILRSRPECTGRVGATGFCLGGNMAYLAAARCDVDFAIAYYGTNIQDFLSDASQIACPTLLHIGEKDHTTPPEAIAKIVDTMRGNPNITIHIYADAPHAFGNIDRADTFRPSLAEEAHARSFTLINRATASESGTAESRR
jgi:carboxymethylenebutenolidase